MDFKKFINKFSYYFRDCYGSDKLTTYLFIGGLILSIFKYTFFLGGAMIIIGIYRCFSKNKYKRSQELAAFENFLQIIKSRFYSQKNAFSEAKKYKVLKCPNCSQKLRVPKNKGKIVVTCKKCGKEFKAKS